ncbi:MAG TPA: hypothetical protein VFQ65_20095 [Kofleriaceae bacterium]|nr:hypothetical protein [Kofleriaceae bacterium]
MILERLLFAGDTCVELARALSLSVDDVRAAAMRAMRTLRDATTRASASDGCDDLLALHALRALDADEAEAVRRAISASLDLRRRYLAERDLVAAVCGSWPIDPPARAYRRILASIEAR